MKSGLEGAVLFLQWPFPVFRRRKNKHETPLETKNPVTTQASKTPRKTREGLQKKAHFSP
jgi:hypothetical protein